MVQQAIDGAREGWDALRSVPPWLLLLVLVGSPTLSAALTGNQAALATSEAVASIKERLDKEVQSRQAFEAKCQDERQALERRLADFRIEQQRVSMMLEGTNNRLAEMATANKSYQEDMRHIVRDLLGSTQGIQQGLAHP